jgi:hypothetical protein
MLCAMSYRIQISPEARSLLLTLRPHVLLRLGRALAELAESVISGGDGEPGELRVDGCVLHFVVDNARTLLEVIGIEQREIGLAAADAVA